LKRLDPNKLSVEYRKCVTPSKPIIPRRYTLNHSDINAKLFLTVGSHYAYDKLNPSRDEVIGEWQYNKEYILFLTVYINGNFGPIQAGIRNKIFIKELPLALEAIRYGEKVLFQSHPFLDDAPIYIYFKSTYPRYNRVEYWGKPVFYK
jgi:hypothetical protein